MTRCDAASDRPLDPAERLEAARADLARRARLGDRVAAVRQSLAAARGARAIVARRVESEAHEVERMEGGSAAALWSRLRGRQSEDLVRRREALEQAQADLAVADARVAAARAEVDRLVEESRLLVDADQREQAALVDLSRGSAAADGLDPVRVAQARAEVGRRRDVRELDLAIATGSGLLRSLHVVQSLSASFLTASWSDLRDRGSSWATYDRLSELAPHLQAANEGLSGFSARAEALDALATGRLPPLVAPQLHQRDRAVDRWVDDPVTDAMVRGEARELASTARIVVGIVAETVSELQRRRALVPDG